MRIIPYDSDESLEDIDSLYIIIKAVPFEDTYAPAMVIVSPEDQYKIDIDELNCLMDGIEIAEEKISEIINYILNTKTFRSEDDDDE
jgi:hypothetical protein